MCIRDSCRSRLTTDGAARINSFHSRVHNLQAPSAGRIATSSTVSTSTNPTRESGNHLKLVTKREELVSKLSIVSRAVSTRAATQAFSGILLDAGEAGVEEDAGEGLGRGAGGNGPGDDRELGDELLAFGDQLQVIAAFSSWISACGNR